MLDQWEVDLAVAAGVEVAEEGEAKAGRHRVSSLPKVDADLEMNVDFHMKEGRPIMLSVEVMEATHLGMPSGDLDAERNYNLLMKYTELRISPI